MEITELTKKIIETFDLNIPQSVTFESYNSGTLDLTSEGDEFDGSIRELLGVGESDQTTIDNAIQRIQEVINDIKTNESIDRKELVIEFLEILVEKLNDL